MKIRRTLKKLLCFVLAFSMVMSFVTTAGFAAEIENGEPEAQMDLICGKEEHTHTEECYESTLICGLEESEGHTHTEECAPTTTLELTCGLKETEGHTHSEECHPETVRELTCGLEESEGHTHSEECAPVTTRELTCGLEETEGHTHTDECYVTETVLTCEIPENHVHTVDCYKLADPDGMGGYEMEIDGEWYLVDGLICEIPENHTHTDGCWTEQRTLTCTLEETEPHTHSDECYTEVTTYACGLEETEGHTHTDECWTETTTYACGLEETEPHTHSDDCYTEVTTYACGLEETEGHTHTDACYEKTLICGKEEHTHTDECYAEPMDDGIATIANGTLVVDATTIPEGTYTVTDGNHTITVTGTWNGNLIFNHTGTATIVGNGTIDASGKNSSAIVINSGTVVLDGNVTIKGGIGTEISTDLEPGGNIRVGGGVYVQSGKFVLNNGTISGNTAQRGGGIFVNSGAQLEMNGGAVDGNKTVSLNNTVLTTATNNYAGEGGGIFVLGTAIIKGGKIINNACTSKTDLGGGGLYVNNGGIAYIYNAIITGNTADGFGGGIAGCCHAETALVSVDGAAVYGNTARGTARTNKDGSRKTAGNVVDEYDEATKYGVTGAIASDFYAAGSALISNYMIGGGSARFEGKIDNQNIKINDGEVKDYYNRIVALKANPTQDSISKVPTDGVLISGNTSTVHGGGIGCNGVIFFGGTSTQQFYILKFNLNAEKELHHRAIKNEEFTFGLFYGDTKIAEAKNDGSGHIAFNVSDYSANVVKDWKDGQTVTFIVKEIPHSDSQTTFDKSEYSVTVTFAKTSTNETTKDFEHFGSNQSLPKVRITYITYTYTGTAGAIYQTVDKNGNPLSSPIQVSEIKFVNEQKVGSLSIHKVVEGIPEDKLDKNKTFTFTITGPGYNNTVSLKADETVTLHDLLIGNYTITETTPAGDIGDFKWTDVTYSGNSSTVTVTDGGTAEFTATNHYKAERVDLNLKKLVNLTGVENNLGENKDKEFVFVLTGEDVFGNEIEETVKLKADGEGTFSRLAAGTYTLTESGTELTGFVYDGLKASGVDILDTTENSVKFELKNLEQYTTASVAFTATNDYTVKKVSLTLEKEVLLDTKAPNNVNVEFVPETFYFDITGKDPNGNDVVFDDNGTTTLTVELSIGNDGKSPSTTLTLPVGKYTIKEHPANVDHYTYNGLTYTINNGEDEYGAIDNTITVELTENDSTAGVKVHAINNYTVKTFNLKINKIFNDVIPDEIADGLMFNFTLSGKLANGKTFVEDFVLSKNCTWEKTFNLMVDGEYTITESAENRPILPNYDFVSVDYSVSVEGTDFTQTGNSVSFHGGEVSNIAITAKNNYEKAKTVNVSVTKSWSGEGAIMPDSITVNLVRDDVVVDTVNLTAPGWSHTWTDLLEQQDQNSKPYTYRVDEVSINYTSNNYSVKRMGSYYIVYNEDEYNEESKTHEVLGAWLSGKTNNVNEYVINNAWTPSTAFGETQFEVRKVDEVGNVIPNVEFTLSGNGLEAPMVQTTDGTGTTVFYGLMEGDYTLTETWKTNDYDIVKGEWIVHVYKNKFKESTVNVEESPDLVLKNEWTWQAAAKEGQPGVLTVVNNVKTFNLELSKTVNFDLDPKVSVLDNVTFTFHLEGTGLNGKKTDIDIQLTKSNDWSDVVENLPYGTYTLTEKGGPDVNYYTFVEGKINNDNNGITFDQSSVTDGKVTVTAENYYTVNHASLNFTKIITANGKELNGDNRDYFNGKTYTFNIECIGGPNLGATYSVTVDANSTKSISLPVGIYAVTEGTAPSANNFDWSSVTFDGDGKLEDGKYIVNLGKDDNGSFTVNATNDYTLKTGSIDVSKAITLDGTETEEYNGRSFTFTLSGTTLNGDSYSDEITVKSGETETFKNVPYGNYEITETGKSDLTYYSYSGVTYNSDSNGKVNVTVDSTNNGTVTVTAVNNYTLNHASIDLTKKVIVDDEELNEANDEYFVNPTYTFTVECIEGPEAYKNENVVVHAGETVTLENLPVGVYQITETTPGDEPNFTFDAERTQTSYIVDLTNEKNTTITVEATNYYTLKLGSVSVTKEITLDGEQTDKFADKVFTFTLSGTTLNGESYSDELTVKSGETKTFENVPYGSYTIIESGQDIAYYTYNGTTYDKAANVTVNSANAGTVSVNATNSYTTDKASFEISKAFDFDGVAADGTHRFVTDKTYTFTLSGTALNGTVVNETLVLNKDNGFKAGVQVPVGTYTLAETGVSEIDSYTWTGVTYGNGVTKNEDGSFSVDLSGKDASASVTAVNSYEVHKGSISFTKSIEIDGEAYTGDVIDREFRFNISGTTLSGVSYTNSITVKNGETKELPDVPYGTYEITEDMGTVDLASLHFSGMEFEGVTTGENKITVVVDGDKSQVSVHATNSYTRDRASLTISKDFTMDGVAPSERNDYVFTGRTFTFRLHGDADNGIDHIDTTINLTKEAPSASFSDIPVGVYTLEEVNKDVADYSWNDVTISGEGIGKNADGTFTVDLRGNGVTIQVSATNYYNVVKNGSVSVTKVVLLDGSDFGTDVPTTNAFTFTLQGTDLSGHAVDTRTVTVKAGETNDTLTGLPYGDYTISELTTNIDNYDYSGVKIVVDGKEIAQGEKFTIDGQNNKIEIVATNSYERKLTDLSITKTITGNNADASSEWDFTVAFYNPVKYVKFPAELTYTVVDAEGNPVYVKDENGQPTSEVKQGTLQPLYITDENGDQAIATYTDEDGNVYTVYGTVENLSNEETAVINNLPVGVLYHVAEVEENTNGYSTYYQEGQDGTLAEGIVSSAIVNNSRSHYTRVSVQKVWADDRASARPTSITVQLMQNGNPYGNPVVLDDSNNWSHEWLNLRWGANYTVEELDVPEGYTVEVTGSGSGAHVQITVTNRSTVNYTSYTVNKVWAGDDENTRPASVSVQLMKDGTATGAAVELSAANSWTYTWTGLDAEGTYSVVELNAPDGYTVSYDNSSAQITTITNTWAPAPETTQFTVNKYWVNTDGSATAPAGAEVTVELTRNGEATGITATLNAGNNWSCTFDGLLANDGNGSAYVYGIVERAFEGYTAEYTVNGNTATITNRQNETRTTTVDISVNKVWQATAGVLVIPESVTVQLLNGDQVVDTAVLTAANGWSHTWTGLDATGSYTVAELPVEGWTGTVTGTAAEGFTVTNVEDTTTTNQSTSLTVTKNWVNADGSTTAPEGAVVTVELTRNGEPTGITAQLSAANGWTYVFTDLAIADGNGAAIAYGVVETAFAGYTAEYYNEVGTVVITNRQTPDIPEEDIPFTDIPDDDTPLADIPDDDTPLADLPDEDVPLTDIPDDDVPKTGDSTLLSLWLAMMGLSGLGLLFLTVTDKKKSK